MNFTCNELAYSTTHNSIAREVSDSLWYIAPVDLTRWKYDACNSDSVKVGTLNGCSIIYRLSYHMQQIREGDGNHIPDYLRALTMGWLTIDR